MASEKKWGVGSHIWMCLLILIQWLLPIEYWTKPITATSATYQWAALVYTIEAALITVLFIWLWISKKRAALTIYIVLAGIHLIITIIQSGFDNIILSLLFPVLTYIILRPRVD